MLRVTSSSDVDYQLSASDVVTNDANYHRVQLTRHLNNVTLMVDNLSAHHLTRK